MKTNNIYYVTFTVKVQEDGRNYSEITAFKYRKNKGKTMSHVSSLCHKGYLYPYSK